MPNFSKNSSGKFSRVFSWPKVLKNADSSISKIITLDLINTKRCLDPLMVGDVISCYLIIYCIIFVFLSFTDDPTQFWEQDRHYFSRWESSRWLSYVSKCLEVAQNAASAIAHHNSSVILQGNMSMHYEGSQQTAAGYLVELMVE